MNLFNWIKQGVKNAIFQGVEEAADELGLKRTTDDDAALTSLRGRLNALPAPSSNGEEEEAALTNGHAKHGKK